MGKFLNTLVKTACAGVMAFSIMNSPISAQNLIEPDTKIGQNVSQEQNLYSLVKGLDNEGIVRLYKSNQELFYEKYKDYSTAFYSPIIGKDYTKDAPFVPWFNKTLDDKIFKALEEFDVHNFIVKEKDAFGINPESTKIWENLHKKNHAYFIKLFFEVSEKIEGQDIEKGLDSIYATTKDLFKFNNESKKENILLNWAIDSNQKGGRQLDSYQLSLVYSDLAKLHDIPISVVRARDFFLIKYEENKFFDPLTSAKLTSQDIKQTLDISNVSIENKIYLTPLKEKQVLAIEYARMGKFVVNYIDLYFDFCIKKEIPVDDNYLEFLARKSLSGFEESIKNDVYNIDAFRFMGDFCDKLGLTKDALFNYNRVIQLDPNDKKITEKVKRLLQEKNKDKL